jgi:hypothetical protein
MTIVHISTELRLAWRRGLEAAFAAEPDNLVPYQLFSQSGGGDGGSRLREIELVQRDVENGLDHSRNDLVKTTRRRSTVAPIASYV